MFILRITRQNVLKNAKLVVILWPKYKVYP